MIEKAFLPVFHMLDAETAHRLTVSALKSGLLTRPAPSCGNALKTSVFGKVFPNPVGLAAGFDKNAECMDAMFGYGFGFVEIGTVTPKPQEGNPRPRVFRDKAGQNVINRMGFPNEGADAFEERYRQFRETGKNRTGIVGINVGKNKDQQAPIDDYVALVHRFAKQADYITVNISSPNTPGLRDLQDPKELTPFLRQLVIVRNARCRTPLLVKFAPDLTPDQCAAIARCAVDAGVDGLILTNTTLARPDGLPRDFAAETGGLSGQILRNRSLEIIRTFYKETGGAIPIIGAGGIASADDAYAAIRAGASLVQLYSAMVYQGPGIARRICKGLAKRLKQDGFETIADAVGADHR